MTPAILALLLGGTGLIIGSFLGLVSLRLWPAIVDTLRHDGHAVALSQAGSLLLQLVMLAL